MLFKCKNCGGNVVYEPGRGRMYCPHCESEDSQDTLRDSSITQCVNCGAPLELKEYASASRCGHCGSYLVFNERVEGVYEPHMILPFRVNKDAAIAAMNREFERRAFTPSDFMSAKSLEKMEGVYVPFWLYDYQAEYDFAGEGTKVRCWRSGDTEYVETSYYEVLRKMDVDFDKIPVDASYAMEDGIMDLMEPYRYQELIGFEPKYMSGFYGEIYNQGAQELEGRAQGKAREASEEMMQSSLREYGTVRPYRRDLKLERNQVHYALLPVWQYEYQYKGRSYQYHVNGQTGKVIGVTPVSREKVVFCGVLLFALITAVCALAVRMFHTDVPGVVPWLVGLIATVIFIACNWNSRKGRRTTTALTYVADQKPRFRVHEDRFIRKSVVTHKMESGGGGPHGGGPHGGGPHGGGGRRR
ncbi:MAG: hypothetical protein LUI12_14325 [Clostridiales bacterium]|nr:hypothetical protein [Clostridiales bacterium]